MAVLIALAGFLIGVTLLLAGAIVARHRAGAVADLSALAAAGVALGDPSACARARIVANANAARLRQCHRLDDGSILVTVELAPPGRVPGLARASARAGPADVNRQRL